MDIPSDSEIIEKLRHLSLGTVSREEVATWAQKWVIAEEPPDMDEKKWEALKFLAMVDLISTDRPHLYSAEDFQSELAKFEES